MVAVTILFGIVVFGIARAYIRHRQAQNAIHYASRSNYRRLNVEPIFRLPRIDH